MIRVTAKLKYQATGGPALRPFEVNILRSLN